MVSSFISLADQLATEQSALSAPLTAPLSGQEHSLHFDSHACTHVGCVRSVNEDAYLQLPEHKLWLVSDGMGGHKRGDFASGAVVSSCEGFYARASLAESVADIDKRIAGANDRCQNAFRGQRTGATLAAMLAVEHQSQDMACLIWAGDSRVYRLREGQLEQLTQDHSLPRAVQTRTTGEVINGAEQELTQVLTRAVGVHRRVQPELKLLPIQKRDRFLLCTDGVYRDQSSSDIAKILGSAQSPPQAASRLVDAALTLGGGDNITAVVVDAH